LRTRGITIFLFISLALSVIPAIQNNYTEPIFATSKTVDSELSTEQKRLINQTALRVVNANPGFVGNATTTITSPAAATPEMITALAQVIERIVVQTSNLDQIITHIAIETAANPTGPLSQALLLFAKQLAVGDTIGVSQLTSLIAQLTESPTVNATTQRDITGNISQLIMQQAFQSALGANQLLNQIANKLAANSSKLSVNNVTISADTIAQTIQQIIIQVSLQQQDVLSFQPLLFIANQVNQNPMGPLSKTIVQLAQLQFTGGVGASQSIAQSISELVKQILSSATGNITKSTGTIPTTEPTSEGEAQDRRTKIIIRDEFDEREPPTFQPPPLPPQQDEDNQTLVAPTAQLRVITEVTNEDIGTKVAEDFSIFILNATFSDINNNKYTVSDTVAGPVPAAPPSDGTMFDLALGTYKVITFDLDEYGITFEGDCDSTGTVTLAADEPAKRCTVKLDDRISGIVKVVTDVINDNGGNKTAGDFRFDIVTPEFPTITISGSSPPDGTTFPILFDRVFSIKQDAVPGYTTTFEGDCTNVAAVENQTKTCTIKNDDIVGAQLSVIKEVVNDNGGTKVAGDFFVPLLNSNGDKVRDTALSPTAPAPNVRIFDLALGTYQVGSGVPFGYLIAFEGDCDSTGTVTLAADGPPKRCTIKFDDKILGAVKVVTDVINDNGGNKTAGDFRFEIIRAGLLTSNIRGASPPDGETLVTPSDSYTIIPRAVLGYTTTLEGDCTNVFVVENQTKTCTIKNDDIVADDGLLSPPPTPITNATSPTNQTGTAQLRVVTNVINDNNGNKIVQEFTVSVRNSTFFSGMRPQEPPPDGKTFSLSPGTYYVGTSSYESGAFGSFPAEYSRTFGGDCDSAGVVTLTQGEPKECIINYDDGAGELRIISEVLNDNGGNKTAPDLLVILRRLGDNSLASEQKPGAPAPDGITFPVAPGTYRVFPIPDEERQYSTTFEGDCDLYGVVMFTESQSKECILKFDDGAGRLRISTGVINDDDGNRTRFIIHIANSTGSDVASQELTFSRADRRETREFLLPPGTYTFKHEPVSGYTTTFDDCDSSGQVIISTGLPGLFCHVTLNDIPTDAGGAANETDGLLSPPPTPITGNQTNATLVVNTRVINNHGVSVQPQDLGATVDVFGSFNPPIGGIVVAQIPASNGSRNTFSVLPGSYTISFNPGPSITNFLGNYSFASTCPGFKFLGAGDTKTCIVSLRSIAQPTNGSQPVSTGTLSVKTHVINDNTNSTLEGADVFMLLVLGQIQQLFKGSEEGTTFALPANTQYFILLPERRITHTISRSGDCGGGLADLGGNTTILAGEIKSCTITLDDREGDAQIFSAGNATLQNLTSFPTTTSEKETICDDGIDNDNDVKVDGADEDCLSITSTPTTPDENTTTTSSPSAESEQAAPETQGQQPTGQNNPPTADAGEDSSVESGKTVKLNGDDSKDPDANQVLSYLWEQVSPGSPSVSLDGAKNEIASFNAPQVDKDTKFKFELTVKDGKGGEDTDSVTVEVLGIADEEEQKVEQQAETSKQEQDQQEAESSKTSKLPPGSPSDEPEGKITK
jgi:hypothetical protein